MGEYKSYDELIKFCRETKWEGSIWISEDLLKQLAKEAFEAGETLSYASYAEDEYNEEFTLTYKDFEQWLNSIK